MTDDDRPTARPTNATLAGDRRAVSELLGALLVFALVILLLVLAQVSLVPTLNQQIEYEHNQRIADDFGDLESDVARVAATGAPASTNLELGVTYPNRPLLLNPPPAQGTVRTVDRGEVVVSGVTADNPETDDYWTGADRRFNTTAVEYRGDYNEHRNAGTLVYENSVTYRQFPNLDDRTVVAGEAPLIEGDRISLVSVTGDLQESNQGAETVALSPVSAPSRSVAVRSVDASTPITITTRTRLSTVQWQSLIGDEPNVRTVDVTGGVLTVTLEPGDYRLRMARVGIGEGAGKEPAAYLTREAGADSTVPTSGGEVSVEVRDRFNNPVSGVDVTFEITRGQGNLTVGETSVAANTTIEATSDQRGLATVSVSGTDGNVRVEASADVDPTTTPTIADFEEVVFGVQVGAGETPPPTDDGSAGEINPNRDGRLVLTGATTNDDRVKVNFQNRIDEQVTIESVRINSYQPGDAPGASLDSFPDYARAVDDGGTFVSGPIPVLGTETALGSTVGPNAPTSVRLKFYVDSQLNRQGRPLCGQGNVLPDGNFDTSEDCFAPVKGGENFLVTLTYSYVVNGETVRIRTSYLVAPAVE